MRTDRRYVYGEAHVSRMFQLDSWLHHGVTYVIVKLLTNLCCNTGVTLLFLRSFMFASVCVCVCVQCNLCAACCYLSCYNKLYIIYVHHVQLVTCQRQPRACQGS